MRKIKFLNSFWILVLMIFYTITGCLQKVNIAVTPEIKPDTTVLPTALPTPESSNKANNNINIDQAYKQIRYLGSAANEYEKIVELDIYQRTEKQGRLNYLSDSSLAFKLMKPFEGGMLVLADMEGDGEHFPDLYFVKNQKVERFSYDSDCWSYNYTVLADRTIHFGNTSMLTNGGEPDNKQKPDRVLVKFASGEAVSVPVDENGWYLVTAQGQTWPQSIESFYGREKIGDHKELLKTYDSYNPYRGDVRIWGALHFSLMLDQSFDHPVFLDITGEDGNPGESLRLARKGEEYSIAYAWRNNHFWNSRIFKPGEIIKIKSASDVSEVLWFDVPNDDGKTEPNDLIAVRGLTVPKKKGTYRLVVRTTEGDFAIYAYVGIKA